MEAAATATLQATMPSQPVYCGALTVADVMLAGFTHAAGAFDLVVAAAVSPSDAPADIPDFWWGPKVEEFKIGLPQ